MERSRTYSGGWNSGLRKPPQIATVKPVSKSFSEDDLMKVANDKHVSPRVFSRLKVEDISTLKKDSIIGELEKCLVELEEKSGATEHLSTVYQQVENERNELMDELDMAFQDLQNYMQKQKVIEDQKEELFSERDELQKENEYLKAVLSSRTEIHATKAEEQNKTLNTRVKELELKNTQLVDEINDLYEERQTLISSLMNLHSEDVDDVIKKRSRSSSVTSRESLEERGLLDTEALDHKLTDLQLQEAYDKLQKDFSELQQDHNDLQVLFETMRREFNDNEERKEINEKENVQQSKEYQKLLEDRNEKNLTMSKLNLEKRTLQRQLDHSRESNRTMTGKVTLLTDENENLKAKMLELETLVDENEQFTEAKLKEALSEYEEEVYLKQNEIVKIQGELDELRSKSDVNDSGNVANDSHDVAKEDELTTTSKMNEDLREELTRHQQLNESLGNSEIDLKNVLKETQDLLTMKKNECEKLNKTNEDLNRQFHELNIFNEEIIKLRDELKNTIENKNNELQEKNQQCSRLTKELEESRDQTEPSNELITLKQEFEKQTTLNAKLQEEIDKVSNAQKSLAADYENVLKEKQSLEEDYETIQAALSNENFTNKKLQSTLSELEIKMREKQKDYGSLMEEKRSLEDRLQNTTISNAELDVQKTACHSLEVENNKLRNHIQVVEENHDKDSSQLNEKNEQLSSECKKLSSVISELNSDINRLKNENDKLVETNIEVKTERNKVEQKNKEIEKQQRNFEEKVNAEKLTYEKQNQEFKNKIQNLENENQKLSSHGNIIEKQMQDMKVQEKALRTKYDELEKELNNRAKTNQEIVTNKTNENEEQHSNLQRKFDALKKDNERILHKCRQLEKTANESEQLASEVTRLKNSNAVLLQRYRALQNEKENDKSIDQRTSEREKYSALLVKYDNLCKQYDDLCIQHKKINTNFDVNMKESKTLNEQVQKLETTLTQCGQKFEEVSEENSKLKEQVLKLNEEKKRLRHKNDSNQVENLQNENKSISSKWQALLREVEFLKNNQNKVEKDYQYILQSHKEEAQAELETKQNRIVQERDAMKIKYEHARVELDKVDKERNHFQRTIDSLREENKKLHEQVQKHKLMSNSTQDLMIRRMRSDNEKLEEQLTDLQNTISTLNTENKTLVERIQRHDDNTATTIRSLRARKNELQLQVETLKHDNHQLKINQKLNDVNDGLLAVRMTSDVIRTASNPNISKTEMNYMDVTLTENLRSAHLKISQLEKDREEYRNKFQESETLMFDLQQALAKANDLAMQKALENSKLKKNYDKKIEKLYDDNTELRRKLYFTNNNNRDKNEKNVVNQDTNEGDVTPTSLFPQSPILSRQKNNTGGIKSRKASLPVKIKSNQMMKPNELNSLVSAGNIFTYKDSRLSFDGDSSPHAPLSPRLTESQEMENDLSRQLRELLDLTDGLTDGCNNVGLDVSQESIAPPIPPPPVVYAAPSQTLKNDKNKDVSVDVTPNDTKDNTTSKHTSTKDSSKQQQQDIDDLLDSLTNIAEDLEREEKHEKSFEHWV